MSQYNNIQSFHRYMVSYHEPKCTLDTKLPSVLQFLHPHASIRPAHLLHSGSIFCAHSSTRNYFMSIKASKSSNCQSPKINGPYSRSAHFRTRFFKLLCLKKIALSMLRKLPSKKKKNRSCVFGCFASSVRCDRFQGSEYSINMVNIPLEHWWQFIIHLYTDIHCVFWNGAGDHTVV